MGTTTEEAYTENFISQGMNCLLFVGFLIAEDPMEKRLKVLFRSENDNMRCSVSRLTPSSGLSFKNNK